MAGTLNLLYTANLRGDLARLPRLYSLIARLKGESAALLLDLGGSCSDDAWHCRETGGRSMLIALDAMGYDAANVAGALDSSQREALQSQVALALVDESRDWRREIGGLSIRAFVGETAGGALEIDMCPARRTSLSGNVLRLRELTGERLGQVVIEARETPRIVSETTHLVKGDLPQNPSIAATVTFIESEARLFGRNRMQG